MDFLYNRGVFLFFCKECYVDIFNVYLFDDVRKFLVNVKIDDIFILFINVYV